jgi:hypothetical protein
MKKPYVKPAIRSRPIQSGDIEAGARFAQKRSVPRYPFAARVTVLEPISGLEFAGRTSDISLRGCFVESVDQFPLNSIVQVRIEAASEAFETWGRVAHVHRALGTGVSFLQTTPDQQLILQTWVEIAKSLTC